jgi:hypothetical protein
VGRADWVQDKFVSPEKPLFPMIHSLLGLSWLFAFANLLSVWHQKLAKGVTDEAQRSSTGRLIALSSSLRPTAQSAAAADQVG